MKTRSSSAKMPGRPIRSVIERKVVSGRAPLIIDASSKLASVARRTEDISRKVSGTKFTPSMTIIPHMEYTLIADRRTECVLQSGIDRPRASENEEPCDDMKDVGDTERDDRAQHDVLPPRRVRPFDETACHPESQGDDRGANGIDRGIDERGQKEATREQRLVITEREIAHGAVGTRRVKTHIDQKKRRRNNQDREDDTKQQDERENWSFLGLARTADCRAISAASVTSNSVAIRS